jgi:sulfate adenylyltransferase subunit 2
MKGSPVTTGLSDKLEAEAVHVFREVAATIEKPALLFSGGKDSVVMLHVAAKAFWPAPVPFPVMHVDTGENFDEVLEYRDETVEAAGRAPGRRERAGRHRRGPRRSRTAAAGQPQPAADGDAAAGHRRESVRRRIRRRAPRRGEGPRQGALLQLPRRVRPVGSAQPAPELWSLYNGRHRKGENIRVFPLSNWTELDIWSYVLREDIELPSCTTRTSAR